MFEVHPDDKGQWILYDNSHCDFAVIAWFNTREDAEFAAEAFRRRDAPAETQPGAVITGRTT
jgi:hypothetical protein